MIIKAFPKGQVEYDYNKLKEILDSAFILDNGDVKIWQQLFPFSSLYQPARRQTYIDTMYKMITMVPPCKIDVFLVSNKNIDEVEIEMENEDFPYDSKLFEKIISKLDSASYYIFHVKEEQLVIIVQKTKSGGYHYCSYVYPLLSKRKLEDDEKERIITLIKKEIGKNDYIRYRVNPFDRLYQDMKVKLNISIFDLANYYIYLPRDINYLSLDLKIYSDSLPRHEELESFKKALGSYNKEFYLIKYLDEVDNVYHYKSNREITSAELAKFFDKPYGTLENIGIYFPKTDTFFFVEEYNCHDVIFSLDCSKKIEDSLD